MIRICILISMILLLLCCVCVKHGGYHTSSLFSKWDNNENVNVKNKLQEFSYNLRKYFDILFGPMVVVVATAYLINIIVSWGVRRTKEGAQGSRNTSFKLEIDVNKRLLKMEERITDIEKYCLEFITAKDRLGEVNNHPKSDPQHIKNENLENMYQTNKLSSFTLENTFNLLSPCTFGAEPLRIYEIDSSNSTNENPLKNTLRRTNNSTWNCDENTATNNDSLDMEYIKSSDVYKSINDSEILLSVTELEMIDSIVFGESSKISEIESTGKLDYSETQSTQDNVVENTTNNNKNSKLNKKDNLNNRVDSINKKYCKTLPEEKSKEFVADKCSPVLQNKSTITNMTNDYKERDILANTTQSDKESCETMVVVDAICQVEIDVVSSDIEISKVCSFYTDTHKSTAKTFRNRIKHFNAEDAVNLKPGSANCAEKGDALDRTNQRRRTSHYQKRRVETSPNYNPRLSFTEHSAEVKSSNTRVKTGSLEIPSLEIATSERNGPSRKYKPSTTVSDNVRTISEKNRQKKDVKWVQGLAN